LNDRELLEKAIEAKVNAYVPYSHFRVGAAVLTKDNHVYTGCNIECASFGGTNCAERTALFKAISEGHRDIEAIAVVSDKFQYTFPCGICRQVILEFGENIRLVVGKPDGDFKTYTIKELLPNSFCSSDME